MATQQRPFKLAIVGGGIVWISTALRIQETLPNTDVTVITDLLTPHTTGDVAAGFWTPVYLGKTPDHLINSWSGETYRFLQSLIDSHPTPNEIGVHYSPGYQLYSSEQPPEIAWSNVPVGFRTMTQSELSMFPPSIKSGHFYVSVMAEGKKIIPFLLNRFLNQGGHLVPNTRVTSFDSLVERGFRRIVNCTGLGARELCKDDKVTPIRGQVHRVMAPWMNFWFMEAATGTYCLPNSETVVLGGTSQSGNWMTEVSESDRADIMRRVCGLWPSLASAPLVQDAVGLRPGRETLRLEREVRTDCSIYHNYGHGGSGLSLFWGCAGDVARLVQADLMQEQLESAASSCNRPTGDAAGAAISARL